MPFSPAQSAQASASALRFIFLVDLEFPAGAIYVTDLDRAITVGARVYSPSAVLQGIDGLGDNLDGKPRRVSVQLAGLDPAIRARVLASRIAFGKAKVRMVFCDPGWNVIDTPLTLAVALLSNCEADYDEGSGTLEISMETSAILLERDARQLVSHESQQLRFPGDTSMSRVAAIPMRQISWGGSTVNVVVGGNGSGSGAGANYRATARDARFMK